MVKTFVSSGWHLVFCIGMVIVSLCCLSCSDDEARDRVDRLNGVSYSYHYRNLDSTRVYAERALRLSDGYADGCAEAMNNLAFVDIAKMRYAKAAERLKEISNVTDNNLEQLVGDVQMMRLCQRRSENKDFYRFMQHAQMCMRRLHEDFGMLSERQRQRLVYAQTEYSIVLSTYLYYVGQRAASSEALMQIDPNGEVVKDTAQLLAYYYNVGSGGILTADSHAELQQKEFDYLMRCYLLSRQYRFVYWEANSLQALSEHLQGRDDFKRLASDNMQEIEFLNIDQMPDSLLAGNLSQRALSMFEKYGDVYQVAGAWRTLSESFREIGDYRSAYTCLGNALGKDTAINLAPDLVASIREQMSIVCSAMDDKRQSDYNRNIYLDLQDRTRQDRALEARADLLASSLRQLDFIMVAVLVMFVALLILLGYFGYLRHARKSRFSEDGLLMPLEDWKRRRAVAIDEAREQVEELDEKVGVARLQLRRYKERSVEQRAKVFIASSVMPLINRLLCEAKNVSDGKKDKDAAKVSFGYIGQVVDTIDVYNHRLTSWIKLRQGDFQLHVKSFRVQELFDVIASNEAEYRRSGITLSVERTDSLVKADPVLTLFMLNTIAENARRHTHAGGNVAVRAVQLADSVEISVADDGDGMDERQLRSLFTRRIVRDDAEADRMRRHGFGLANCMGIINKYRKMSNIFSVCLLSAESEKGNGSRFFFRLPTGVARVVVALAMIGSLMCGQKAWASSPTDSFNVRCTTARMYADSVYALNVRGDYVGALAYADSCINALNRFHSQRSGRVGDSLRMTGDYPEAAAELKWFKSHVPMDYGALLDVRNEIAVAALALHKWGLYSYNNIVYTTLFRECSADNTIASYIQVMQKTETNRSIAIALLLLMCVATVPAYYMLYYRHKMYYSLCVDKVVAINDIVADDGICSSDKISRIDAIWNMDGDEAGAPALCRVVATIRTAVSDDAAACVRIQADMEAATDECRRLSMDCDRLYVSNNVLDNCLSSLKHETMYYPSRLKQLVSSSHVDVQALCETANYYHLLYSSLVLQAVQSQQGMSSLADAVDMLDYLFVLLGRKNNGRKPSVVCADKGDGYVSVDVCLPNFVASVDMRSLFTPLTADYDFLVCCQIMRDIGELTSMRGSGIKARKDGSGSLVVELIVPRNIWQAFPNLS